MRPVVSYIRVSTGKQGKSGLGIEAQRQAVTRFAATEGLGVLTEFVEVESKHPLWAAGCSVALGARIIGAKGWRVR
jgi:Resolvase, N terminal domain